ncbi:MAG TPA: NBR1-Ig-like domain-containing protein [Anaerolineales bacterium]|nr:NBR1-Ig-like domain-containing protein [Anaerolineales bacterium]
MFALRISKILAVVIVLALLVPACGSSQEQESIISTAVAQTLQAGGSTTETAALPPATQTLETPGSEVTLTPAITPTSPPTLGSAPADPNCAKASLVNENPPDKTILTPGEYFWKTWTLQNTGTCTWTTAFKLVFWSGDRFGSSISYPLPDDVAPGESKDISIYLQAPTAMGSFTGYWRIKTPWESDFGVGQYNASISTTIVVGDITPASHKTETVFGITAVTYQIDRRCAPANTFYTITAFISSNGPVKINFMWIQSDFNNDENNALAFTEASTKAVKREWSQGKGSSTNQRWIQVVVTSPTYREFDKVVLPDLCYHKP